MMDGPAPDALPKPAGNTPDTDDRSDGGASDGGRDGVAAGLAHAIPPPPSGDGVAIGDCAPPNCDSSEGNCRASGAGFAGVAWRSGVAGVDDGNDGAANGDEAPALASGSDWRPKISVNAPGCGGAAGRADCAIGGSAIGGGGIRGGAIGGATSGATCGVGVDARGAGAGAGAAALGACAAFWAAGGACREKSCVNSPGAGAGADAAGACGGGDAADQSGRCNGSVKANEAEPGTGTIGGVAGGDVGAATNDDNEIGIGITGIGCDGGPARGGAGAGAGAGVIAGGTAAGALNGAATGIVGTDGADAAEPATGFTVDAAKAAVKPTGSASSAAAGAAGTAAGGDRKGTGVGARNAGGVATGIGVGAGKGAGGVSARGGTALIVAPGGSTDCNHDGKPVSPGMNSVTIAKPEGTVAVSSTRLRSAPVSSASCPRS